MSRRRFALRVAVTLPPPEKPLKVLRETPEAGMRRAPGEISQSRLNGIKPSFHSHMSRIVACSRSSRRAGENMPLKDEPILSARFDCLLLYRHDKAIT